MKSVSQKETKLYNFTHVWGRNQKVANERTKQTETQDTDDSMVVARGAGGEEGKEGERGQI